MSLPYSEVTRRLSGPGSDVWQIHDEAVARQQAGDDIILLSVGDPDFPTPDYIAEHTVAQINRGRTHYSPPGGEPALLAAIAELETRITGKRFAPEQFVVFPGATASLYAVFASIANAGDEVIVPEPMYAGYRGLFDAIGISDVAVPLSLPDFELDATKIFDAVTSRTRAVLVNTPGNPCGNLIPPETLAELAQGLREREIWLVCDEVYSLITFESPHMSLLRSTEDLRNVVVIDGLSKSHAMSGWRIGWAVAPSPLVEQLIRVANATLFGTCQFVQDGAAYALANDAPDVEKMRQEYLKRRDYAIERLDGIPELTHFKPRGGMFIMVDTSAVANDGADFARRLLDEAGISCIPGRGFGASAASYVRISLTHPVEILREVFDRIADVAAAMSRH
jgi:arginine:pyruvate transaminase